VQRIFAVPAAIAALASATLFAYISSSPAVFIDSYGVSPAGFAGIFALLAAVFVLGAQINLRLVHRIDVHRLLRAYLTVSAAALVALVVVTARHAPLAVVLGVLAITKLCLGGILPNASAETMAPFARRAGSASALLGMAQMGLGAVTAALLASIALVPAVGMSAVMLVATGLSLALTAVRRDRPEDTVAA
jgi:DHA1 family bicyclomycin/chloramphenicol resistance-like MFS transporter